MHATLTQQRDTDQQPQAALSALEDATRLAEDLKQQISREEGFGFAPGSDDAVTCFRADLITDGQLYDPHDADQPPQSVSHVALQGVAFRTAKPLRPGTVMHLRTKSDSAALHSKIRVVSCRLRADGAFDIKAEFF